MRLGKVIGNVWATKKMPQLTGQTFLLIRMEGEEQTIVAIDAVGAGPGDRVLVTVGGGARTLQNLPVDSLVVGIVDATIET